MGTIVDLNELQFFHQVARAQSFTEAARHLGLPKSTVSRALRRLEDRLGVRLLERTTRRVALTEVGELYLNHCQRVLEEAEQADLAVGALLAEPRGRLRVGMPIPFARFVLGPILAEFLKRYPALQVQLQLLQGIVSPHEGNLDLVIGAGTLEDSNLLVRPLLQVHLGLFASPDYVRARGVPGNPQELREHSCITTSCDVIGGEPGMATTWRLRRDREVVAVQVEARVAVADPSMNQQLALAGTGVATLSVFMTRDDLAAGRLVRLLPDWEPEPVEVHALYPSRLNSSPKVRAFLEFLRERAGERMARH